jgi:16S rRNA (guanine1207-N2)-methyltransferase
MSIVGAGAVPMNGLEADAADRLILAEAAAVLDGADVVAIGSAALAEGAVAAGARGVEIHVDTDPRTLDLDEALLAGAAVVLVRLPKSLEQLDDIARAIATWASPDVVVFAGARLKYMTRSMNDVLARSFERVDVSLARQKSRVLIARAPRVVAAPGASSVALPELDLVIGSAGGVFAGGTLDIGTRVLLDSFDRLPTFESAIDLGCGTGILAASLKRLQPEARVIATDASAAAVSAATETMRANGLDVEVVRDLGLASQPDASADLVVLNPPFHDGGAVTTDIAFDLFADAARVLRPGGQLWTVFNSHLQYRPRLESVVGPTREIARTPKFSVTASTVPTDI